MLYFGEKIKQARLRKNFTQKELGDKLDVSNTVISNWEKNINRPDVDILETLCGILDIEPNSLFNIGANNYTHDEADLVTNFRKLDNHGKKIVNIVIDTELERIDDFKKQKEAQKHLTNAEQEYTKIIYFDTPVSAGTGQYLDDSNYIMLDVMEEPPSGAKFIVRVCGDSMEPTYNDGDKLYIKPQDSIPVGEIGIFSVNSDVYVKERDNDGLVSHNKEYPKIKFNEYDNIKCYGQVVGTCKKYR